MNKSGIWSQQEADQFHQFSPKLAKWISGYLSKNRQVIDFGAGNGYYLNELSKEGFQCTGVEGSELNNSLFKNIVIHDLTKPIDLGINGDVISLETGEHLPPEAEQTFIDTITKHCAGDLILSWALPHQPGIGHWNCLSKEYVINQITSRGFDYYPLVTQAARENVDDNTDWFRRTLLIFGR